VCAKWQGLNYLDDPAKKGVIENVSALKMHFRCQEMRCCLCDGMRGSYNPCREPGCKKAMHITCARATGLCTIIHPEGGLEVPDREDGWTLCCPEHSNIDPLSIPAR